MSIKYSIHNSHEHEAGDHGYFPNWGIQQDLTDPDIEKRLVDRPEQLLNAAVLFMTDDYFEGFCPVRLEIGPDGHHIMEYLVLSDAMGPDAHAALRLNSLMLGTREQSDRLFDLKKMLPEADSPGWDEEHAYRALKETYGDEFSWFGLGADQCPDECLAVLARHLVGRYSYWTWRDYSRATMSYRLTVGRVHPDDPEVQLLDTVEGFTRADWAAAVAADLLTLAEQASHDNLEAATARILAGHDSGPLYDRVRDAVSQHGITLGKRERAAAAIGADIGFQAGVAAALTNQAAQLRGKHSDAYRLEAANAAILDLQEILEGVTNKHDLEIPEWAEWEAREGADLIRAATEAHGVSLPARVPDRKVIRQVEAAQEVIKHLREFLSEVDDERDMAVRDWRDWEAREGAELIRAAAGSQEGRDV